LSLQEIIHATCESNGEITYTVTSTNAFYMRVAYIPTKMKKYTVL